jgi:hypothetical protein
VITGAASGIIAGFGFQSYVLALRAVALLARGDTVPPGDTPDPDGPEPPDARPMAETAIVSGAQDAPGDSS